MKKRIGTDLFMSISISAQDNTALDLNSIYDYTFSVINTEYLFTTLCENISISSNTISFQYSSL